MYFSVEEIIFKIPAMLYFNFIWFSFQMSMLIDTIKFPDLDELFPKNFLACENPATHSILTTKKSTTCHVKRQKQDELKR